MKADLTAVGFAAQLQTLSLKKKLEDAPKTVKGWTRHAFGILHEIQEEQELYCHCRHHEKDSGKKREWLWDMGWYPRSEKVFSAPLVILEHENIRRDDAFLDDLWKVLVGVAPLRIMLGYVGAKKMPRDRHELVKKETKGWSFPCLSEDLICTWVYGVPGWHFLHRARGQSEWLDLSIPT